MNLVYWLAEVAVFAVPVGIAGGQDTVRGGTIAALRGAGNPPFGAGALVAAILMVPNVTHFAVATGGLRALLGAGTGDAFFQAGARIAAIVRGPALAQGSITTL